jgi:hypothetical protein
VALIVLVAVWFGRVMVTMPVKALLAPAHGQDANRVGQARSTT